MGKRLYEIERAYYSLATTLTGGNQTLLRLISAESYVRGKLGQDQSSYLGPRGSLNYARAARASSKGIAQIRRQGAFLLHGPWISP